MAAGNIKGITIEIGGDTTKLSKALSGVNSSCSSLQKELREVDKLLKLDTSGVQYVWAWLDTGQCRPAEL